MRADLLNWLRCPRCGGALGALDGLNGNGALECNGCRCKTPIRNGVPRFVEPTTDAAVARTRESFGYEWTHFNDWRDSGAVNFNDYFQDVDLPSLREETVLDAGCGMGRHARQIAPFVERVIAVDFSDAIDQAAKNTGDVANVDCVQADLLALPFPDNSFGFVYSLGVLHHLNDTERALGILVRKVRPGGRLRVYLYWKRHGWKGVILSAVTAARRITTRLPFPALRAMCRLLSVVLYTAVVLPYRALVAMGVRGLQDWPLFVYSKYPFIVLYNDQFDRFSAPIEKRYDPAEVRMLLENAGLHDVQVRSCFGWLADGTKPV